MKGDRKIERGTGKMAAKEYACRRLGYDCSWKYIGRTEELLLDRAALHLRDVHGVQALGTDLIGRIRNSLTNPSPPIEGDADIPVMKELRCRDLGMACDWHYLAQTEELIVDGAAVHARTVHGIMEFSPEMIAKVKNSVHIWKPEEKAA